MTLNEVLLASLPFLSPEDRAIIAALVACRGRPGCAQAFAMKLGLRSRHQLLRVLRRDGLPPFEQLAAWIAVLGWLWEAEARRLSLFRLALAERRPPPTCYRTVRRITGFTWMEARRAGFYPMFARFLHHCRAEPEHCAARAAG